MVGFAGVCKAADASTGEVVTSWGRAYDDVIGPFGIEAGDPPKDRAEAREMFEAVVPQVRERFDGRITKLFRDPVHMGVIDNQEIGAKEVKRAFDLDLISEMHANALIQSALHANPTFLSRIVRQAAAIIPGGVVMSYGMGNIDFHNQDYFSPSFLVPLLLGFTMMFGYSFLTLTGPSISKRFNDLTKGKEV
jgi:hypothetical protein